MSQISTHNKLILNQCFISIPPRNIRKLEVLRCLQGVKKWSIALNGVEKQKLKSTKQFTKIFMTKKANIHR